MTYRVAIAGLAPKYCAGFIAAYRVAQNLANVHGCRVNIEQDCGRLGWITCEWCEPIAIATCEIDKTR